MLGHIYLFDTKTNKIIKSYTDTELYEDNNKERINIRDNFTDKYNERFILKCSCNQNIELSIDSLGRVYHKKQSDLTKHDKFCIRHKYYDKNFKKGWNEISKDDILVNLNFNIYNKNNDTSNKPSKINSKHNSIDLCEFTKHLNIKAYTQNLRCKYDILSRIYYLSHKIRINGLKNKKLSDFYFDIKSFKTINKFTPKFVYMYLDSIEEIDDNYIKINCNYSENKLFSFISNKELFYKDYLSRNINKIKSPVVISGFITKTDLGLEFYELSLIKVNNNGVY